MRHSEALYEDDSFPERELAALVAAKVYYQLQEYNESMVFALGAGKLFDIHKAAEFEETIMGKTHTNTRRFRFHILLWQYLSHVQNSIRLYESNG
jgi:hypothetical protein